MADWGVGYDHEMHTGAKANAELNFGKAVVIANGTGAGQWLLR
eukprot:COSAG03_NODE_3887_length_1779_cov_4.489881_3_plen_43_part_00